MASHDVVDLTLSDEEQSQQKVTETSDRVIPRWTQTASSLPPRPDRNFLRFETKNQKTPNRSSPMPTKYPSQQTPNRNVQVRGSNGRFTTSPHKPLDTRSPLASSPPVDIQRRKVEKELQGLWLHDRFGLPETYNLTIIRTETLILYADLCRRAAASTLGKEVLWAPSPIGVFAEVRDELFPFKFDNALVESAHSRFDILLAKQGKAKAISACRSCAEQELSCNGLDPCSSCEAYEVDCVYDNPHKVPTFTVPALRFNTQAALSSSVERQTDNYTTHSGNIDAIPDDILGSTAKHPAIQITAMKTANEADAEPHSDTDPDSDAESEEAVQLKPDIEEIFAFVKQQVREAKATREYLLVPVLRQARIDARKAPLPQWSSPNADATNPFAKLIAQAKARKMAWQPPSIDDTPLQSKDFGHGGQGKVLNRIHTTTTSFRSEAPMIPKYKSIGRVGPSVLARNVKTLKYWPYSPDDERLQGNDALKEKYQEYEDRYNHNDESLKLQRKCEEIVSRWKPTIDDILRTMGIDYFDILNYFIRPKEPTLVLSKASSEAWHQGQQTKCCPTCKTDFPVSLQHELDLNSFSSGRLEAHDVEMAKAGLACATIGMEIHVSLWHAALLDKMVREDILQSSCNSSTLCMVCCLHNCPTHGSYKDASESGLREGSGVATNDPEDSHNIRQSMAVRPRDKQHQHQQHTCSFYCLPERTSFREVLGRRANGIVVGEYCKTAKAFKDIFDDNETCGDKCFWNIEARPPISISTWSESDIWQPLGLSEAQKDTFKGLLSIYSNYRRGPCLMHQVFKEVSCVRIFEDMLEIVSLEHGAYEDLIREGVVVRQQQKKEKNLRQIGWENNAALDERPPFVPCAHLGPCQDNDECSCWSNKVACEYMCDCDASCGHRWRGCECSSTVKACFEDDRCACWKANRECDPWVCGSCGVLEVLDPHNRYNEQMRLGRCRNNRLQLGLPARTVKAPSEVQGWGLYSGEDLKKGTFIGEYRGEIVSKGESDRRGAVYSNLGQEYLFTINSEQEIDASNIGNKMRFMNNSQLEENINVVPKKLLCNGVQRVMLYAKRDIKAGQELLYNYGYPEAVTKKFWERGEGPLDQPGKLSRSGGSGHLAKIAGSSQGRKVATAKKKRKRSSADINDPTVLNKDLTSKGERSEHAVRAAAAAESHSYGPVIEASDDSDYSDANVESEASPTSDDLDEDEDEENSGDSEDDTSSEEGSSSKPSVVRKRIIQPGDKRFGGQAQKAGWRSRKKGQASRTGGKMPGK